MMYRFIVSFSLVWLYAVAVGAAQALTFPALSGRVVDEARLLSPNEIASLTASLADLESRTTYQFVIVTLKSLQSTTIEDFGYQLGRQWGIGQKGSNSGALLIVAPSERKVRIEVGYGLEHKVTDAISREIIERAIVPAFRTGNYSAGIRGGADEIVRVLRDNSEAALIAAKKGVSKDDIADPWVVWIVILLAAGGLIFLIYRTLSKEHSELTLPEPHSQRRQRQPDRDEAYSPSRNDKPPREKPSPFRSGGGTFGGGGSSGSW
jgi:uncharacterized protein